MSNLNLIPIGKLFDLEKGSLQSSKCTEGEYTFITAAEEWKTHNEYSHECEALIFAAAASGSLGRTHYINDKFITSDLCFILTPKDSKKYPINLKFYHFVFNSLKDEIVKNTKSGTSKESINQSNLRNYEIPYFEIDKQNLWIDKLVNTKSIKEDLELELSTGQSLLKQLKQTILQEAIEGKLTAQWRAKNPDIGIAKELLEQIKTEKEKLVKDKKIKASKPLAPINEDEISFDIPSSWEWCRLGEVCNYGSSSKIEPKDIKEDTWILDLEDIEKESSKLLCKIRGNERNSSSTKSVFHQFDVLYSKLRPYLDKVIVADENGVCTTEILPLTFYINIDSYYAMYALKRKDFLKYVNSLTKGMKMPRLGTDDGKNALFPLPPLEEQKEIVATIEKLFAICDELESEIKQNKITVQTIMATVLKEAFEN